MWNPSCSNPSRVIIACVHCLGCLTMLSLCVYFDLYGVSKKRCVAGIEPRSFSTLSSHSTHSTSESKDNTTSVTQKITPAQYMDPYEPVSVYEVKCTTLKFLSLLKEKKNSCVWDTPIPGKRQPLLNIKQTSCPPPPPASPKDTFFLGRTKCEKFSAELNYLGSSVQCQVSKGQMEDRV